jgi:transcriptional regulator with XRE-family HTH domain
MLASVSSDYYTRLEQGRSLPSPHVTQALAQALKLDAAATSHLHELARRAPEPRRDDDDTPSAHGLQTLLDQWSTTPAWVSDRYAQVLAADALMTSLNPAFTPTTQTPTARQPASSLDCPRPLGSQAARFSAIAETPSGHRRRAVIDVAGRLVRGFGVLGRCPRRE